MLRLVLLLFLLLLLLCDINIYEKTGVSISTKGRYFRPDEVVPAGERKLYLLLIGDNQEKIDQAIDILKQKATGQVCCALLISG